MINEIKEKIFGKRRINIDLLPQDKINEAFTNNLNELNSLMEKHAIALRTLGELVEAANDRVTSVSKSVITAVDKITKLIGGQ